MPVAPPSSPGRSLEVQDLQKSFYSSALLGPQRRVTAVRDVSFRLDPGEAVALVGESGSGKSTIARLLLRLDRPDGGEVRLGEESIELQSRRVPLAYRRRVQMVFQDPFGSLNPVHDVAHHLVRPLLRHRIVTKADARARAAELLRLVGLEPAEDFLDRHPYELSGGQRQRVAIARALAPAPEVLIADEPTSMLDVSIRMGVLDLLARLKRDSRIAILLITHDLASARVLADRILVLFRGRIVEEGPSASVVDSPIHPYTRALIGAIADASAPSAPAAARTADAGEETETGCPFASRCPEVFDRCRAEDPAPRGPLGRRVRCHLVPEEDA
ncbi:MAG: ABC transporter ATP-binding protein [bacterium]